MTKFLIISLLIIMISSGLIAENIKALVVVPHLYGANFFLNMEMFEQFGWDVTTTGVTSTVQPCAWGNPINVDVMIEDIDDISVYDCVVIAPMRWWQNTSNAYIDLINSEEFNQLLVEANEAGKVIYATCAGVRVLAFAGILDGVRVTGRAEYQNEYIQAGAIYLGSNLLPVIDENIVTSTRGQYFMVQNCEAIQTAIINMDSENFQLKGEK